MVPDKALILVFLCLLGCKTRRPVQGTSIDSKVTSVRVKNAGIVSIQVVKTDSITLDTTKHR